MAEGMTRVVHETIGSPIEYIYVLIRETPGSHHIKAGKALPEWTPEERQLLPSVAPGVGRRSLRVRLRSFRGPFADARFGHRRFSTFLLSIFAFPREEPSTDSIVGFVGEGVASSAICGEVACHVSTDGAVFDPILFSTPGATEGDFPCRHPAIIA